jgi:hypothetical protein
VPLTQWLFKQNSKVIPNKETEKFKQNPQISQQMKPNPDAKTTNLHKYKKEIRRVYKFNKALHYSLSILRTRALP